MSDCKHIKKTSFMMIHVTEFRLTFNSIAETCDKCGSKVPKKPNPVEEPKTPTKLSEKFEQCSPSKGSSPFRRLGSFLRLKSKDDKK